MIATARAQRRAPAAGAESRGPHGAAGAATPPIERDAHVGPDIEGEHSMGEIIDDDAVKGGSSVDRERGPGPQQSTEDQSTRQGGRFPLSKRVPEDSLLRDEAFMADDGSDSSEDERPPKNTVGDVPLEWYQHEEHIGYDRCVLTNRNSCTTSQGVIYFWNIPSCLQSSISEIVEAHVSEHLQGWQGNQAPWRVWGHAGQAPLTK